MISKKRVNEKNPAIDIVALSGRLGVNTDSSLDSALMQVIDECEAGMLIDMADVEFVSSAGLRLLMLAGKRADAAKKKMALMKARPAVYKIFKLTACHEVFDIFDNEEAALAGLK